MSFTSNLNEKIGSIAVIGPNADSTRNLFGDYSYPAHMETLREFQRHLFIVFSGVTRKAADVVAGQLARVGDNRGTLNRMRAMVDEGWDILTRDRPMCEFGRLLHEAWIAKQSLDPAVSRPEIDDLYQTGLAHGALGGKLLGAGGGGFLLFFAPPEAHGALRRAFADRRLLTTNINAPGSQIIFASDIAR